MRNALREGIFPRMAERRVPQVVSERHSLRQVLVQSERAGRSAGYLRHLDRMRQTRPIVVSLGGKKYLRFMGQAPERLRMQDLVAIALVIIAQYVGVGLTRTPLGLVREGRVR